MSRRKQKPLIEGHPWSQQKKFQLERGLTPTEFINMLAPYKISNRQLVMITLTMYGSGSRASELLGVPEKDDNGKVVKDADGNVVYRYSGLRPCDIEWIKREDGKSELSISTMVLKTRGEPGRKKITIPTDEGYYLYPLVKMIDEILDYLGYYNNTKMPGYYEDDFVIKNTNTTPLFTLGLSRVEQWMKKRFKLNPHSIRHLRFTHLAEYDKMNAFNLQQIGQWESSEMPFTYATSSMEDIKKKMWDTINNEFVK